MSKKFDPTSVLALQIPCTLAKMADALSEMNRFLAGFDLDESILAKTRVVFRELLANAMTHGNKAGNEQPISVEVGFLSQHCLRISVKDPGDGFDYRFFGINKPSYVNGMRGRGSYLIRSLTDWIEFNETGNHITVYLSLFKTGSDNCR